MLKIGWGSREFTPTRPAMLQGQMHVRVARTALDPLQVTAMAMESDPPGDSVIFLSCDLAFPSPKFIRAVREGVRGRFPYGVAQRIIVNATHTHTSLVLDDGFYQHPGGDVMTSEECSALVIGRAVEAVVDAWESRVPRTVGRAFGHAVVGHNRYATYTDGTARMYGKTHVDNFAWVGGYEDHSLDMLFTWDPDGRLAGVALSIPCPSQVTESIEEFSSDYWHEVRVELRRRLGDHLHVLPLCSAAGDQSPHFLLYDKLEEEMRRRRGVTERQEIALRVADAVERALECTRPEPASACALAHRVRELSLTARRIRRADRDWAAAALAEAQARSQAGWWPENLRKVVESFDNDRQADPFPVEIHVVRIGDLAIATNPFELFLDYGLQIKAWSRAAQTMLIQLTGRGMYLPSARALQGGGYGVTPAVSPVGPEGGGELVRATVEMIREVFAQGS